MSNADVVRALIAAYRAQDREAAEELIAIDLRFNSPQDDHIDRAAYFERCFPTADRFTSQEVVEVVETSGDGVFLLYEYQLTNGDRYRNTEFITVHNGQIHEIQVYFGGRFLPAMILGTRKRVEAGFPFGNPASNRLRVLKLLVVWFGMTGKTRKTIALNAAIASRGVGGVPVSSTGMWEYRRTRGRPTTGRIAWRCSKTACRLRA